MTYPSGRVHPQLVFDEPAAIVWAAQMNTVVFHAWPSRAGNPDNPDQLRIDLDPQPGTALAEATRAAFGMRAVLAEAGLTAFVKTSGNRGLHLYAPIRPDWEFLDVRHAVIAAARELERREPDAVTTAWWKELRGERIFLDYNQAARDRTIAGAYSPRPLPTATVSTPVTWEELETGVIRPRSPSATVPDRLASAGDPWAAMHDEAGGIETLLAGGSGTSRTAKASCRSRPTTRRCRASRRACSRRGPRSPTEFSLRALRRSRASADARSSRRRPESGRAGRRSGRSGLVEEVQGGPELDRVQLARCARRADGAEGQAGAERLAREPGHDPERAHGHRDRGPGVRVGAVLEGRGEERQHVRRSVRGAGELDDVGAQRLLTAEPVHELPLGRRAHDVVGGHHDRPADGVRARDHLVDDHPGQRHLDVESGDPGGRERREQQVPVGLGRQVGPSALRRRPAGQQHRDRRGQDAVDGGDRVLDALRSRRSRVPVDPELDEVGRSRRDRRGLRLQLRSVVPVSGTQTFGRPDPSSTGPMRTVVGLTVTTPSCRTQPGRAGRAYSPPMTDIDVVATIPIRPEAAESARPHLLELADATRAEEGCRSYSLFESRSAPGVFVTVERWREQSDVDAHMRSPHIAKAFAVLTELLAGEVAIHPLTPVG